MPKPTKKLITENLQEEMKSLGGPSHPTRKKQYAKEAGELVRGGSLAGDILDKQTAENNRKAMGSMRRSGAIMQAEPKIREPLGTWKAKGIPYEIHDPEKLKDVRKWARLFYATHNLQPLCHPAGTKVIDVNREEVSIEEIREGDEVLTHKGRYRKVYGLKRLHFEGNLYTLKTSAGEVSATPEHPFYVFRGKDYYGWVRAHELSVGDYLLTPIKHTRSGTIYDHHEILSIETNYFSGTVYNFEVEEDESYVANGFASHNCVDTYARFPVQGAHLTSKDKQLTQFYEELFFDSLNYDELLVDFGREYWTVGESTTLGSWSEVLGVWEAEEFLNPDDIMVKPSSFSRENSMYLKVPEHLKEIVKNRQPAWEYDLLVEHYPEIIDAVMAEEVEGMNPNRTHPGGYLSVDDALISRSISKVSPWDMYGTPHMMRCFSQLMMEESLNASQDAIADRLYAPFLLAKLGATASDMGDNEGPWIPDEDEISAFSSDIQSALAADFRLLVHHFGVDIKSVFGREQMPRFDNDYSRLERQQLQVWGIGESMISGSSNGAYASSALNREYVTQHMSTYQKQLKKHFRRRAMVVAEAQEHFDYRVSGGIRYPIYEEALKIDPDTGEEYIVKRPKLLVPDLEFSTINLHDESQERQFRQTLKNLGVPISDGTLIASVDIDLKEETEKVQQDKIDKVLAEAEYRKRTVELLKEQGLWEYASDDVRAYEKDSEPAEEGSEPEPPSEDITDPAPAPNVAPVDEDEEGEESLLPENQIKQRPEISDEQRKNAPKTSGAISRRPSVIDLRETLNDGSVVEAVRERRWTRSLKNQLN